MLFNCRTAGSNDIEFCLNKNSKSLCVFVSVVSLTLYLSYYISIYLICRQLHYYFKVIITKPDTLLHCNNSFTRSQTLIILFTIRISMRTLIIFWWSSFFHFIRYSTFLFLSFFPSFSQFRFLVSHSTCVGRERGMTKNDKQICKNNAPSHRNDNFAHFPPHHALNIKLKCAVCVNHSMKL